MKELASKSYSTTCEMKLWPWYYNPEICAAKTFFSPFSHIKMKDLWDCIYLRYFATKMKKALNESIPIYNRNMHHCSHITKQATYIKTAVNYVVYIII